MYHKHLREDQWKQICSALSGGKVGVGRPVSDNRKFVEAVIWIGKNSAVCLKNIGMRSRPQAL